MAVALDPIDAGVEIEQQAARTLGIGFHGTGMKRGVVLPHAIDVRVGPDRLRAALASLSRHADCPIRRDLASAERQFCATRFYDVPQVNSEGCVLPVVLLGNGSRHVVGPHDAPEVVRPVMVNTPGPGSSNLKRPSLPAGAEVSARPLWLAKTPPRAGVRSASTHHQTETDPLPALRIDDACNPPRRRA